MVVVDIADLAVSRDTGQSLITYSLGSCIGLAIWDPLAHVGGVLHYMLPDSQLVPERARASPAMFCDTGVPRLFHAAYELGAAKTRLVVKVAGGGQLLGGNSLFNIGKQNYLALRKIFWKNGIAISAEDVGGCTSRTLRLDIETGVVRVKTRQQEVSL